MEGRTTTTFLALTLLLALVLTLSGVWVPEARAPLTTGVAALEKAERTYDRMELQQVIDQLTAAWTLDRQDPQIAYYLARACLALMNAHDYSGESRKAEEIGTHGLALARSAVELDPDGNPDAYRVLGDFYGRLSFFQGIFGRMRYGSQSIKYHKVALARDPGNVMAVIGAGADKLYAPSAFGGDVTAAVSLFQQAIAMASDSPVGHVWLAKAYAKRQQFELARTHFEKALEINSQSGFARAEFDLFLKGRSETAKRTPSS